MDQLLAERDTVNRELRRIIDEPTEGPWGIRVERVEIKDVTLPEGMKRSMSRQAEAERERRARIITADGEYQASKRLAAAANVMARDPAALQLRLLQTVVEVAAEKNSTLVMPVPVELLRFFDKMAPARPSRGPWRRRRRTPGMPSFGGGRGRDRGGEAEIPRRRTRRARRSPRCPRTPELPEAPEPELDEVATRRSTRPEATTISADGHARTPLPGRRTRPARRRKPATPGPRRLRAGARTRRPQRRPAQPAEAPPAAGTSRPLGFPHAKWEYVTVPLLVHATKEILDNWGDDGWELVAVVPGPNPEQLVAYMKRAKGGRDARTGSGDRTARGKACRARAQRSRR